LAWIAKNYNPRVSFFKSFFEKSALSNEVGRKPIHRNELTDGTTIIPIGEARKTKSL
jgi:hypothetical protein